MWACVWHVTARGAVMAAGAAGVVAGEVGVAAGEVGVAAGAAAGEVIIAAGVADGVAATGRTTKHNPNQVQLHLPKDRYDETLSYNFLFCMCK